MPDAVRPPVHALLVTWNHYAVTRDCLKTLFASDYPADRLTVWVVDNASSDETVASIRAEFPQIRLLEHTWNAGFAHAVNRAAQAALDVSDPHEAPLLLILNNDTLLDPAMLSTLVDALQTDPKAGIATPAIYYADDPERLWYAGGGIDPVACRAWHEGIRTPGPPSPGTRSTDYASGCCLLLRGSVARETGLLDEGYFMYWEDADLCQRAKASGSEVLFVPEAKLWHRVSTSTGGNLAPKKLWRKFAAGYRFWGKYHQGSGWQMRYLRSGWQDLQRARKEVR